MAGSQNFADMEIEELRAEIQQEKDLTKLLDRSIQELEELSADLKDRYREIEAEQNEWRTRFEIQEQVNQRLSQQIEQLKSKMHEHGALLNSDLPSSATMDKLLDMTEVTPYMLKLLEREKVSLNSEWNMLNNRIDEESKAYYAAIEKRKQSKAQFNDHVALVSSRDKTLAILHDPLRTDRERNAAPNLSIDVGETFRVTKVDTERAKENEKRKVNAAPEPRQ